MLRIKCIWICMLIVFVLTVLLNIVVIALENTNTENDNQLSKSKTSFTQRIKSKLRRKKKPKKLHQQIRGLSCEAYGGPSDKVAAEMVYWRDIPSDRKFRSPFHTVNLDKHPKYLTFEPDGGDWNNKRMGLETAAVMALVLGRILVLPPSSKYVIYTEIFPFESIASEYDLKVITMDEFLTREGLTGNLKDADGVPKMPEKTNWDGDDYQTWDHPLWPYLRNVTKPVLWDKDYCIAGIPDQPGDYGQQRMRKYFEMATSNIDLNQADEWRLRIESYTANPTPVDAPPQDRLRELLGRREELCLYDKEMHRAKYLHNLGDGYGRMLTHFYALLFFEDWRQDLWVKRFVRDHFRYVDELQCAAARIVEKLRQISVENGDPTGAFDTFHIRRGDFLAFSDEATVDSAEIYNRTRFAMTEGSVIYIATDEKDKSFFDPLKEHYKVYFMDDFQELISGFGKNKFGQLDQLVASRGRNFFGVYFSTFTGYINRMRAYHAMKDKLPGYEEGAVPSYYYADLKFKYHMRQYRSIMGNIWGREYPVAWRDIDHDVLEEDIKS